MSGPPIELTYSAGGIQTRISFDTSPVKVGRVPGCDLVIDDGHMSRAHALLERYGLKWSVKDSDSANGTKVNGKSVKEQVLEDGDTLQFGRVKVACRIPKVTEVGVPVDPLDAELEGLMTQSIAVDDFDELVRSVLTAAPDSQADPVSAPAQEAPASATTSRLDIAQGPAWILSVLKGTTDALLSVDELDEVLARVLALVCEHLHVDYGAIFLAGASALDLELKCEHYSAACGDQSVKVSRSITNMAIEGKEAVLVKDARGDERLAAAMSIVSSGVRSAMCAPLVHGSKVVGVIYVAHMSFGEPYTTTQLETLSILASLSAAAVDRASLRRDAAREKENRIRLSRYHAPAVVDRIIGAGCEECEEMTSDECEISVLFCDLVGFTKMSEKLSARKVTQILNELFEAITGDVFNQKGTLDKFIGDAVMAFFGAPEPAVDHAKQAVRAGLAMQATIQRINAEKRFSDELAMRVGINSGLAIVGDVGARNRKDYTCIGDTVNVASRLEGYVAKRGQVVIGPRTRELVGDEFEVVPLEKIMLRNREQETQPYLVLGPGAPK